MGDYLPSSCNHYPGQHDCEWCRPINREIADLRAQLATERALRERAEAQCAAMREWAAAWLIRVREACCYREGWEEGMTAAEAGEAITDVLANLGCDAGTEDPRQVAEAKRLLALEVPHAPPDAGSALLAELGAARDTRAFLSQRVPQMEGADAANFAALLAAYDAAARARKGG